MKIKYLSFFVITALFASCSNDDPEPTPGVTDVDDSANIEYTADNAASWGNYMTQVSALLKQDAQSLYDSWAVSYEGGKPFAEIFKTHSGGDYSSARTCIGQILDGCADIANEVGTAKIGDPYNLMKSGDKQKALYAVESWYSWHSREDYSNNIYSIRNAYYGSLNGTPATNSICKLVESEKPELDNKLRASIEGTANSILAIAQPFRNNIDSDASRNAMQACADLEELISNELKPFIESLDANDSRLQAIVEHYVDDVVLPTYATLRDRNAALHQSVLAFKAAPSDEAFQTACEAWLSAREPWEKSEAFLFGPVDALGLDPNMDSWPLDQDAIVQILNSGKYDNLNWSDNNTDEEIEAVQSVRGFHTLEFLLFKDGNPRKIQK